MDASEAQGTSRTALPNLPVLDSPAKCAALWPRYPQKVVGMWATGLPRQNVDVLWRLREELLKLGVPVVFFFNESAGDMLRKIVNRTLSETQDIYQLDDVKYFRLLNFVEVLVTNDYLVECKHAKHIKAKLVGLPHCANVANPTFWNRIYDYFVSEINELSKFDYNFYIDSGKIHRNSCFTQLVVGYPKLDLLLEERKKASSTTLPVLLIYPTDIDFSINKQNISQEKYIEIWSDVISTFLDWRADGIVVFRPVVGPRHSPVVRELTARFLESGRFIIDEDVDNKFWLVRAGYFITDFSQGFINFSLTALRPAIRMFHSWEEDKLMRDEWGWLISSPSQLLPLLEQMDTDEKYWTELLSAKQKCEMPTLGQNFTLLAGMLKRILDNDDDPMWLRLDKAPTPCKTSADMLKIVAKWVKHSHLGLIHLANWVNIDLIPVAGQLTSKIWLLLLRYALLSSSNPYYTDSPNTIASQVDVWLGNALEGVPSAQCVGLLRYLMGTYPQKSATALLLTVTSVHVQGPHKKRALFFLLMEWGRYDPKVIKSLNDLAERMPQHFSRPVLNRLNRILPLAMKVPRPLRRIGSMLLGIKKPLAKKYWQAHRALA